MKYHYRVDYIGAYVSTSDVTSKKAGDKVAQQVEQKVNAYMDEGYELYQQFKTNVRVEPGCLSGLMGARAEYRTIITTVFRKPIG